MMCGIAYAQPGVDSTQTLPNPTPMTAKEYKFKYIQALNTISARSKFFGYDSAFFKNGIYTDITPPADDSSDLVPNTDWVMRQLAAYTPGGGGAEDTLILGRGIARDSLAPTKNRIYLDSSIYRVVQLNDSTLEFAHYDGRLDTVVVSGSGGGTGWGLSGNAITTGDFLGTTNGQKLMFKVNNAQSGLIDYSGNNVSLGYQSFLNNTSGSSNNAIGSLSLQSNTSGAFNNAMGHFSLYTNTSGALNTAIGNGAMYFNTTGSSNNAVGYQSLYANTTGIENNGFGVNSIRNNTTGQMNTAMGDSSLVTLTTGSRNTAIGANADVATSSTDSAVAIGYQAVAATKQIAFSPHLTTMFLDLDSASGTAPAIAGIDENGNWRKYATPSGSGGSPAGNYGNIQINRNGAFDTPAGDSLSFTTGLNVIGLSHNFYGGSFNVYDVANTPMLSLPDNGATNEWSIGDGTSTYDGTHISGSSSTSTIDIVAPNGINVTNNLNLSGAFMPNNLSGTAGQKLTSAGVGTPPTWKDTLAVSGVYAPLASPTFTGTVTIPTLSISTTVSGAGTWTAGAINTASNVTGNLGLFGGGVRAGNNTNIYWNSGPVILGNTNDVTIKNAAATAGANVSIGTSAAVASAQLEVTSTTKGFLPPRMTATQGSAISSPAEGLLIYVTDTNGTFTAKGWWGYDGAAWQKLNN